MEIVKLGCGEDGGRGCAEDAALLAFEDHAAHIAGALKRRMPERPAAALRATAEPASDLEIRNAIGPVLSRVIEAEIIPRLALTHQHSQVAPRVPDVAPPAGIDVDAFVGLLRRADYHAVLSHVQDLGSAGIGAEQVLLDLFAPAARRLGELWKGDVCDFVEVTVALSVLQQLVRDHSARVGFEAHAWTDHRRILLAPAPGDQHTFGVAIVEKFFRAAGWEVWGGAAGLAFDLPTLVRTEWFGVIGFSLGCEKNMDALVALIRRIRQNSRNPRLGVVVGGPAFLERPDLATLIGADAVAVDAQSAVPAAQSLLELSAGAF